MYKKRSNSNKTFVENKYQEVFLFLKKNYVLQTRHFFVKPKQLEQLPHNH